MNGRTVREWVAWVAVVLSAVVVLFGAREPAVPVRPMTAEDWETLQFAPSRIRLHTVPDLAGRFSKPLGLPFGRDVLMRRVSSDRR